MFRIAIFIFFLFSAFFSRASYMNRFFCSFFSDRFLMRISCAACLFCRFGFKAHGLCIFRCVVPQCFTVICLLGVFIFYFFCLCILRCYILFRFSGFLYMGFVFAEYLLFTFIFTVSMDRLHVVIVFSFIFIWIIHISFLLLYLNCFLLSLFSLL